MGLGMLRNLKLRFLRLGLDQVWTRVDRLPENCLQWSCPDFPLPLESVGLCRAAVLLRPSDLRAEASP